MDMAKVIREATVTNGVKFTLVAESDDMVLLDCSRTRTGSPHYLELPRRYKTARGARLASALLAGEKLKWHLLRAE